LRYDASRGLSKHGAAFTGPQFTGISAAILAALGGLRH